MQTERWTDEASERQEEIDRQKTTESYQEAVPV